MSEDGAARGRVDGVDGHFLYNVKIFDNGMQRLGKKRKKETEKRRERRSGKGGGRTKYKSFFCGGEGAPLPRAAVGRMGFSTAERGWRYDRPAHVIGKLNFIRNYKHF